MARMFNPPHVGPSSNKMKSVSEEQKQETAKNPVKDHQKPKQEGDK